MAFTPTLGEGEELLRRLSYGVGVWAYAFGVGLRGRDGTSVRGDALSHSIISWEGLATKAWDQDILRVEDNFFFVPYMKRKP